MSEALVHLAREQDFPYWLAMATILRGSTLFEVGEIERGIAEMTHGLAAFRATGAQLWMPYFLGLLAEGHGTAGEQAEGLRVLSEALDRVGPTGERWFEAELYRRKGEVLLCLPEQDREAVEACFRRAIAVAQEQQAKLWELRAATSFARLRADQGKRAEAYDLLAPIYSWFTEGFDTADLNTLVRRPRKAPWASVGPSAASVRGPRWRVT
jgi:predicted ATPase